MVDFDIFPDIVLTDKNKRYSVDGKTVPIIPLVEDLLSEEGIRLCVLTGEGSIGKSTSLKFLRCYLMKKGKQYFYYDLNQLNYREISTLTKVKDFPKEVVLLLDGFDEIRSVTVRERILNFVKTEKEKRFILLTSRFDPYERETLTGNCIATVEKVSEQKIKTLIPEVFHGNQRLIELLGNTMMLSIFLNLSKSGDGRLLFIQNEPALLQLYFEQLYRDKYREEEVDWTCLANIGKTIYKNFEGDIADKVTIPSYLNTIFFLRKGQLSFWDKNQSYFIESISKKYADYAVAMYILSVLNETAGFWNSEKAVNTIKILFDVEADKFLEAFTSVGQMLVFHKNKERIVNLLKDKRLDKVKRYKFPILLILMEAQNEEKRQKNIVSA